MYVPFHVYSMRQAIEEGYILDVLANYITYDTKWRLRNAAVEQAESRIGQPRGGRAEGQGGAGRASRSCTRRRWSRRRKLIVDDFRDNIAGRLGGRAKAMVVTTGPAARARPVPGDPEVRRRCPA